MVVSTSTSGADALAEAVDLLEKAGYTASETFSGAESQLAALESADYTVLVQIVDVGKGTTVSCAVAPKGS